MTSETTIASGRTQGSVKNPRALGCVLWVFGIAGFWVLTFWAICAVIPGPEPGERWKASAAEPRHPDFVYLMFPKDGAVPVYSTPEGPQVGVLSRAVANSQDEVDAGGWIAVREPTGDVWVRFADLRYVVPPARSMPLVDAYAKVWERKHRSGSVGIATHEAENRVTSVTFRRGVDDGWEEFQYDVAADGSARPSRILHMSAAGAGVNGAVQFIGASVGATVLSAVVAAGVWAIRARRLRGEQ